MVKDGYEEIMNIDISSVEIDMMRRKYEHIPQLAYLQMDVRDMSFFPDDSFDSVIDKGTFDSLMCGADAPITCPRMLGEVSRLLKTRRVLYYARPGFERTPGSVSLEKSKLEPVLLTEDGMLPPDFVLDNPDCHYIYVCQKADELTSMIPIYSLTSDLS